MRQNLVPSRDSGCFCVYLCSPRDKTIKVIGTFILSFVLFSVIQCSAGIQEACTDKNMGVPIVLAAAVTLIYMLILMSIPRPPQPDQVGLINDQAIPPRYSRDDPENPGVSAYGAVLFAGTAEADGLPDYNTVFNV